jgi:acyl-CoA hydrolase
MPDSFVDTPPIPARVVLEGDFPLAELRRPRTSAALQALGRRVAELVPEGAPLQFGPGAVGEAVVSSLTTRVRLWSGIVTDAVIDLAARGLLLGLPRTAYLIGSADLYRWADGRAVVDTLGVTHDPAALAEAGIVAVNTALEIDVHGQIGVEYAGGVPVGAAGGWPDFANAASRSRAGRSVVAQLSHRRGVPTLVDQVRTPVTGRFDVDVVVTEAGATDLRGLTDPERTAALKELWARPSSS